MFTNRLIVPLALAAATALSAAPHARAQCNLQFRTDNFDALRGGYAMVVGDLNHDDKPDIVTVAPGYVSVLLGNGDGTFASKVDYPVGTRPYGVVLVDVDHDGNVDIATADYDDDKVYVLPGNGDGTFGSPVPHAGGGTYPQFIVAADLNQDGDPDLVIGGDTIDKVAVLLGDGDGYFHEPVFYDAGAKISGLVIGDLNGDERFDVVTIDLAPGANARVLLGDGKGGFAGPVSYAVHKYAFYLAIGDVNNDGIPDLFTTGNVNSDISVLLGNGDGTFQTAAYYKVDVGPKSLALGDLNSDGKVDLAVATSQTGDMNVLLGNGDGTFQDKLAFDTGQRSYWVAISDVNADDRPDMVVYNPENTNISVMRNTSASYAAPHITQQPTGQVVAAWSKATFHVEGKTGGGLEISYQWRKNGSPLSDGDNISGATTATLTIDPALAADIATYDAQVSIPGCDGNPVTTTSVAVVLGVTGSAFELGDLNCDGNVDFNDIDAFVVRLISKEEYEAQYPNCK